MKITVESEAGTRQADLYSPEGQALVNELWTLSGFHNRVMYQPVWLGVPIIQFPSDILMLQELVWKVRPELVVETGVAHGGTSLLFASILELLGKGRVLGVDVEIRQYNRLAIQAHPLAHRIQLLEGSSIDPAVTAEVARLAAGQKTLVLLDSNHSYDHVRAELEAYAPLVSSGSYLVVMDGIQEFLADTPKGRPEWREDNPLRAIREFLAANAGTWEVDPWYGRLGVTCAPMGFLRRVGSDV